MGFVKTSAKVTIVAALFYWLASKGKLDFQTLGLLFKEPETLFLIFSFWILGPITACALRWHCLLSGLNVAISRSQAWIFHLIGTFFSSFMPGSVSGDVMKALYVHKSGSEASKTAILLSILADRAMGLFVLTAIASVALVPNRDLIMSTPILQPIALIVLLGFATFLFFGALIFIPRLEDFKVIKLGKHFAFKIPLVVKIYSSLVTYRQYRKYFMKALLLAFAYQIAAIALYVWLTAKLNGHIISAGLLLVLPLGFCLTAIPLAPGGLGVGHVAFEELFALIGLSNGANVFNLGFVSQLLFAGIGAIPYFLYPYYKTCCEKKAMTQSRT